MMLTAHNVSWSIRDRTIVDGISLEIAPGETLGLIGPNGSGKSTLLRLLSGVLSASCGEVRLEGLPLGSYSRRAVAQHIALVEQQAETSDRMAAKDAVEIGRTPWLSPLQRWSEDHTAAVERALDQVGMMGFSDRDWHTLSGGERQRLHIARALAQEPRIMLLDEPTNHLDIEHQIGILALIRKLDLTTVVAMHDLNQAMACDRVCVLNRGRLIALGSPNEVLTPELLRVVFRVQARFIEDPADRTATMRFLPLAA